MSIICKASLEACLEDQNFKYLYTTCLGSFASAPIQEQADKIDFPLGISRCANKILEAAADYRTSIGFINEFLYNSIVIIDAFTFYSSAIGPKPLVLPTGTEIYACYLNRVLAPSRFSNYLQQPSSHIASYTLPCLSLTLSYIKPNGSNYSIDFYNNAIFSKYQALNDYQILVGHVSDDILTKLPAEVITDIDLAHEQFHKYLGY